MVKPISHLVSVVSFSRRLSAFSAAASDDCRKVISSPVSGLDGILQAPLHFHLMLRAPSEGIWMMRARSLSCSLSP